MSNPKYCQAQADFYAEMAGAIKRPDYRDWWLSIAQEWRELADEGNRELRRPPTFDPPVQHNDRSSNTPRSPTEHATCRATQHW